MKIKCLLKPILIQLQDTIELYGEEEYDYDNHQPHVELMYGDTYQNIDDIYFIVEDDGDVVLRINTDELIEEQKIEKYDLYRFLDDMEKVMSKYNKTFAYNWDDKGIYIKYLD